jgi:hypothetical protein
VKWLVLHASWDSAKSLVFVFGERILDPVIDTS